MLYIIGTKQKEYYPVWSPEGDIIAECLNIEDAKKIVNALNLYDEIQKQLNIE